MIKKISFFILLYTLLGFALSYWFLNSAFALSFMVGGLAMLANVVGLSLIWRLIFYKKSIALAVFIIIFKYLILGMILWSFASVKWLSPVGFVCGLAALLFAVLLAALLKSVSEH
jgi:hypothetical protein